MALSVVNALGLVTVQDLGRPGRMHEGLAPGGALVPGLLIAANRAVGNRDGSPAIEVLGRLVVRAGGDIETSAGRIARGQTLAIESEPQRAAYLAIRGGVSAELVLGGYATQLSAGIGARLRAGEQLRSANEPRRETVVANVAASRAAAAQAPIQLVAGPDSEEFASDALAQLCSAPYRVLPTSDRVGTRLDGPAVTRGAGRGRSQPMVRGAIEVPPDGVPIVLGPEHPTIGGYPIVAVVAHRDLDRLFATRIGGQVRFAVSDQNIAL